MNLPAIRYNGNRFGYLGVEYVHTKVACTGVFRIL